MVCSLRILFLFGRRSSPSRTRHPYPVSPSSARRRSWSGRRASLVLVLCRSSRRLDAERRVQIIQALSELAVLPLEAVGARTDSIGSVSHQLMPSSFALSTEQMSRRSLILSRSISTSEIVISPRSRCPCRVPARGYRQGWWPEVNVPYCGRPLLSLTIGACRQVRRPS